MWKKTNLMRQKFTSSHTQFIKDLKSQAFVENWYLICSFSNLDEFNFIEHQTHFYLTNRRKRKETIFIKQKIHFSSYFVIFIDKVQSTSDINETLDEFPNFDFNSFFTVEILSVSFIFSRCLCHWKHCVVKSMINIYDNV